MSGALPRGIQQSTNCFPASWPGSASPQARQGSNGGALSTFAVPHDRFCCDAQHPDDTLAVRRAPFRHCYSLSFMLDIPPLLESLDSED